jgi:ABC-2 type transport system ATP-binding protein
VSTAIDATNVSVSFGETRALRDVSLGVDFGEVVALLGPNGAGKTTLVDTLLGFRSPNAGQVLLHGLDPVRSHHDVTLRTGALLQRGGVWFPMTPAQALDLTATYYPAPRSSHDLIEQLSLQHCANTPWRRLSGGEQQRTLLALALIGQPRALLLDEPTTAVDPEGRQVIRDIVRAERERGCAILLTTHELDEAELLADRVTVLHEGAVLAQGALHELSSGETVALETSSPIDASALAAALQCEVTADAPTRVRCVTAGTPAVLATITTFLSERAIDVVSLRTRATLEEWYLTLLANERSGQ